MTRVYLMIHMLFFNGDVGGCHGYMIIHTLYQHIFLISLINCNNSDDIEWLFEEW